MNHVGPLRHAWDVSVEEACRIQRDIGERVVLLGGAGEVGTVAGVDVAYDARSERVAAAVVVFETEGLDTVDEVTVVGRARFDYVPGLLAFREMPVLLDALAGLRREPDLIVCDGHGYAHPRRAGLACHLGQWTDIATIGCAKQPMVGQYNPPGSTRGSRQPMVAEGETVGYVLRTRDRVKPVFVSPGHRIGFDEACAWILRLTPRYRLPETTRRADRLAAIALGTDQRTDRSG
jgi:deoxyribonuclease V